MSVPDGLAAGRCALASRHAADPALATSQPRLVPGHLPWSRAPNDRPRRPRSRGLVQAASRGRGSVRLEDSRLGVARQPLPPARRDDETPALTRHAAPERPARDAVQPPLRPLRTPLPGPLRDTRHHRRALPRHRDRLHLRELDPGWSPRLAVARSRGNGGHAELDRAVV